jgi:hypothetical protein
MEQLSQSVITNLLDQVGTLSLDTALAFEACPGRCALTESKITRLASIRLTLLGLLRLTISRTKLPHSLVAHTSYTTSPDSLAVRKQVRVQYPTFPTLFDGAVFTMRSHAHA